MSSHNEDAVFEVAPPVLQIVPVESLLPHEEHDEQRSKPLIKRIEKADTWLHPPIVTRLPDRQDVFVVLDGANRSYSAMALGFPHILVQVVDYHSGQVHLDTWNHVVSQLSIHELLDALRELPNCTIEQVDLLTAQAKLAERVALVYLVDFMDNQKVYIVSAQQQDIAKRTELLRQIVDCYKQHCVLDRVTSSNMVHIKQMFNDISCLVVFPHYEPSEILFAAREKILLPPGISRHIIHGRAMRLLYPIERLQDSHTALEEKNRQLQTWIAERTKSRSIRFYAESVYLFDD